MGTRHTVHATKQRDYAFRQGNGQWKYFCLNDYPGTLPHLLYLLLVCGQTPVIKVFRLSFCRLKRNMASDYCSVCLGVALILFTSYLGSYIKFRTDKLWLWRRCERIIKWLFRRH